MSAGNEKLLLVGAGGMLARKVAARVPREDEVIAVDLPEFDVTDQAQVRSLVDAERPAIIMNCAAYTNVDGCETERDLAERVNGTAVGFLAEAAKRVEATLVHVSTDYVFDGVKQSPYVEEDPPNPQSAYGRSKLQGEQALLASGLEKYFIIRTSWLYGPGGNNFVETIMRLAKERDELGIVADQLGSPTYTGDLAEAIFSLLGHGREEGAVTASASRPHPPFGIYHFSNNGQCSWYEFANKIVALARSHGELLRVRKIRPIRTEDYPLPAKRPAYSVFSKDKIQQATGMEVPTWQESLEGYMEARMRQ